MKTNIFVVLQKNLCNILGSTPPIDQQYAHFKTELTPWLSDVPSQILRNGATKWKNAYGRYFAKLGGRPVIHKKHGKQSVWITKELFKFAPIIDKNTDKPNGQDTLQIGTTKHPLGILNFKAHKEYRLPASIHISVHANQWYLSFNYDDGIPEPSDADIIAWLKQHSAEELALIANGFDRGVNIPLAGNIDGQDFDFKPIEKKRLSKQERYAMKWQRKQSRRVEPPPPLNCYAVQLLLTKERKGLPLTLRSKSYDACSALKDGVCAVSFFRSKALTVIGKLANELPNINVMVVICAMTSLTKPATH